MVQGLINIFMSEDLRKYKYNLFSLMQINGNNLIGDLQCEADEAVLSVVKLSM